MSSASCETCSSLHPRCIEDFFHQTPDLMFLWYLVKKSDRAQLLKILKNETDRQQRNVLDSDWTADAATAHC